MLRDLGDWFAQYRMMLSPAAKRQRTEETEMILARLLPTLGANDTVIDCGANVGEVTSALAETGATVIAFEPDPVAFAALSERVAGRTNVVLHNAAVGVRDGTITLLRDRSFHKDPLRRTARSTTVTGGRRIANEGEDTLSVTLVDFPKFLRQRITDTGDITFIKIDVEGTEIDLLEAMEADQLFEHIGLTVVETHEKKFAHLRGRFRKLRRYFSTKYPKTRVNLDWH